MRLNNERGNLGSLFGSKKDNQVANVKLPDFQTDPYYTSSQSTLDKTGKDLLSGNVPDYYKAIGDFDSPQFKQMMDSVQGRIMQGSQEASAINGTGRSGTAVAASNNALNQVMPQLSYADYLRAVNGRQDLLNTGLSTESGVRAAGQTQQGQVNNFALDKTGLALKQASYNNDWNANAAKEQGSAFSNALPFIGAGVGGVAGLFAGNPLMGAQLGSQLGGALGGQNSNLSSFFDMMGGLNKGGGGAGGGTGTPGVADPTLGSFKSSNPDIMKILQGVG